MVKVSQQRATCIKTANVTHFRLRVFYSMRYVHAENAVLSAGQRTWPNQPEKPTEPPAAAEKDDSRARPTGGRCLGGVGAGGAQDVARGFEGRVHAERRAKRGAEEGSQTAPSSIPCSCKSERLSGLLHD